ncbi:MAG TPA: hypothetical protein VK012_04610 [Gemmatimonadales bacterium]|nr:hypothetical protein [Gemmatimonadales bacterium]
MTHLTMDQLLSLREPGSEPGAAAAREHVEACPQCAAELDRLHQRVARLRALPTLRPSRNHWQAVELRRRRDIRRRRMRWGGAVGLALAASLAGITLAGSGAPDTAGAAVSASVASAEAPAVSEISAVRQRSQALEAMLNVYDPENRVIDGHTARVAQALEDRIARVDEELQSTGLEQDVPDHDAEVLQLWRERVGLLDALVDVHVTHASNVGL